MEQSNIKQKMNSTPSIQNYKTNKIDGKLKPKVKPLNEEGHVSALKYIKSKT